VALAAATGLIAPAGAAATVHVSIVQDPAEGHGLISFVTITGDESPQQLGVAAPGCCGTSTLRVNDPGGVVLDRSSEACTQPSPAELRCTNTYSAMTVDLAGGDDRAVFTDSAYFSLDVQAGEGDDSVDAVDEGTVFGGPGADRIVHAGSAFGGADSDWIADGYGAFGGPGDDVFRDVGGASGQGGEDEFRSTNGRTSFWRGGAGDDVLLGGDGRTWANGGAGDDVLRGAGDEDELDGGSGFDLLDGGSSGDLIKGFDRERDRAADCGNGKDTAYIDVRDKGRTSGCERLVIVHGDRPPWDLG